MEQYAQLAGPAVSLLTFIATVIRGMRPFGGLRRRTEALADVWSKLPPAAQPDLMPELYEHTRALAQRAQVVRTRKLSALDLITLLFVAAVAGVATWFALGFNTWWSWLLGAPVALFFLALSLFGVTQLTTSEKPENQ